MRLSEAARLGAMLKPQAYNGRADGGGSCFMRAATEALGIADVECEGLSIINHRELQDRYPVLLESAHGLVKPEDMPIRDFAYYPLLFDVSVAIWTMNDTKHRTREYIADWLEPIE